MRNQGGIRFARTVHGSVLYHRHPLRDLRRGNHLPLPVGRAIPRIGLVRCRGGGSIPSNSGRRIHLGLQKRRLGVGLRTAVLILSGVGLTHAAPVLRLVGSAVGPVPARAGAAAATQSVEAYNIGDGSLSLRATASVPWIAATVGNSRNCVTTINSSQCIPVLIALNTGSLANGMFTGIVTVEDPNAVDAPQTITVTVRVGPIDLYVAPGTARDTYIATSSA